MPHRCLGQFEAEDRAPGQDYFYQGRVELVDVESTVLVASVEGTRSYLVSLNGTHAENARILHVQCDCPRFADGVNCEHLWATLLVVDAVGEAWCIGGNHNLSLFPDTEDEDEDIDELIFSHLDSGPEVSPLAAPFFAPEQGSRKRERSSWRQKLQGMENKIR